MNTILEGLNEAQRAAVVHTQGPALVIAGPGSGKTRVLTHRIAFLIAEKIADADHILAVTFTNKAANEMKERIQQMLSRYGFRSPHAIGTFHAQCARWLRTFARYLDYQPAFSIYDREDSINLLKQILKELNYDPKSAKDTLRYISLAKSQHCFPSQMENFLSNHLKDKNRIRTIAHAYQVYQQRLKQANAMDFDDLLLNTVYLMENFPEILNHLQNRFQFVLIDEFQDTNHLQYLIGRYLAAQHRNLYVVGDDGQSIYAFRGATIENILTNFQKDFPEAVQYRLEQNYRSTKIIVDAANAVINKNRNNLPKKLYSHNPRGEPIKVIEGFSEYDEVAKVVDRIKELHLRAHVPWGAMAILYRINALSRLFEEQLRKERIPYRIFGGVSFYQRKEVKDVLAYLRLIVNPDDNEAFLRVVKEYAKGVGEKTLKLIREFAAREQCSYWRAALKGLSYLPTRLSNPLKRFLTFIQQLQQRSLSEDAYSVALQVVEEGGIRERYRPLEHDHEAIERWSNIEEVLNAIKEYIETAEELTTLEGFLTHASLMTDLDTTSDKEDALNLMSIHTAKGLEFDAVFVVGLEEGVLPSVYAMYDAAQLEEERRIFYVAITRAKRFLTLSYALERFHYHDYKQCEPSRFLEDIPQQLYDKTFQRKRLQEEVEPLSYESDDEDAIVPGVMVHHPKFGKGIVLDVEIVGGLKRARIAFFVGQKKEVKTIVLKYASLKIIVS